MSYVDLLLFRTPGKKAAQLSERAVRSLNHVGGKLDELTRAGTGLPSDPWFGSADARYDVLRRTATTESHFRSGEDIGHQFYRGGGHSFASLRSQAEAARDGAQYLGSKFGGMPEHTRARFVRATEQADDAVDHLRRVEYPPTNDLRQREAALSAARELGRGAAVIGEAERELQTLLRPFARHDDLRIALQSATSDATYASSRAADVTRLSEGTRAATSQAASQAARANATLHALRPGASTNDLARQVRVASESSATAGALARQEPAPKLFALQVAGAYAGTAAVAGGAAYGVYRLTRD